MGLKKPVPRWISLATAYKSAVLVVDKVTTAKMTNHGSSAVARGSVESGLPISWISGSYGQSGLRMPSLIHRNPIRPKRSPPHRRWLKKLDQMEDVPKNSGVYGLIHNPRNALELGVFVQRIPKAVVCPAASAVEHVFPADRTGVSRSVSPWIAPSVSAASFQSLRGRRRRPTLF